jgi:hypothetical protein
MLYFYSHTSRPCCRWRPQFPRNLQSHHPLWWCQEVGVPMIPEKVFTIPDMPWSITVNDYIWLKITDIVISQWKTAREGHTANAVSDVESSMRLGVSFCHWGVTRSHQIFPMFSSHTSQWSTMMLMLWQTTVSLYWTVAALVIGVLDYDSSLWDAFTDSSSMKQSWGTHS